MTTTQQQDVVDLLLEQHNQIKSLFARVAGTTGTVQDLVRLLAVHRRPGP